MRRSVWVLRPRELSYYRPVLSYFDGDLVSVMIDTPASRLKYTPLMEELEACNFHFSKLDIDRIAGYKNIVVSNNILGKRGPLYGKCLGLQAIVLKHSVDAFLYSRSFAARGYIGASQRQVECLESNKVLRSRQPKLLKKLMALPRGLLNEFAYSGPYHIGEWVWRRHTPKSQLRQSLEEYIGCSFDNNKPVVAFFQDEFCHERQVADALLRLSQHVNLVVKAAPFLSALPGVFVYPHDEYSPNLLRFAADFILAGYHSGTLASSTMLGLSVIPYYTSMVFWGGRTYGKRSRYTVYLKHNNCESGDIDIEILETLNSPVDLQDVEKVLERMYTKAYWENYHQRLPEAQKSIFGDYDVNNAAERTGELIMRFWEKGTFGEAAAAVRLRPEFGTLVNCRRAG